MLYYRLHNGLTKDNKPIFKVVDKNNSIVKNKKVLEYIESLVIPPAYKDVKIFCETSPKILYQGYDTNNRLQQIYSSSHKKKSNKKKFCSLLTFGKMLPRIHTDMKIFSVESEITLNKIVSIILRIVTHCGFRIGNLKYQSLYGSFGI